MCVYVCMMFHESNKLSRREIISEERRHCLKCMVHPNIVARGSWKFQVIGLFYGDDEGVGLMCRHMFGRSW